MDQITSTAFRKVYATLTSPVVVTVNGHAIGTYTPVGSPRIEAVATVKGPHASTVAEQSFVQSWNPVPKPSKVKK